jgi:sorting nexin-29
MSDPQKGDKLTCENYRGIALLSTLYKVLSIAINRRLMPWAEKVVGEYQNGFRQGRSTIYHIFSVRQMLEKIYEYNVDLHPLFIDFKQAYDSINREQLLTGMQVLGIPKKLITMTNMTLRNTRCRVKVQNALSEESELNSGLRRGPTLPGAF